MVEYIVAPRAFATPHLFGSNTTLPATFTAIEDCILFTATKESTFKLISQDPKVLHNFLCITGNCNACTVSRLKPFPAKQSAKGLSSICLKTEFPTLPASPLRIPNLSWQNTSM